MVGVLDSGAGENIMNWCLGGRRVGQKSPVEVQHAQGTVELSGNLGSLTVVEIGYLFFQRLGTLSRHLKTEEGHL
jgi:hypothetical protein